MNAPTSAASAPVVQSRWRPAAWHLATSVVVAGLGIWLLVRQWFPPPYPALSGGLELQGLLIGVDVTLGPLLTLIVAKPGKAVAVFLRDLLVILAIQFSALAFGVHTLTLARPVGLVFEGGTAFRVISAADIEPAMLADAPPGLRELSWNGPRLFAAVKPSDAKELVEAAQLGLAGIDLAMQPRLWRDYASQRDAAWAAARPLTLLSDRYPAAASSIAATAAQAGAGAELRFLPVRSHRSNDWVVLLAGPDARVVGLLPLDGFF